MRLNHKAITWSDYISSQIDENIYLWWTYWFERLDIKRTLAKVADFFFGVVMRSKEVFVSEKKKSFCSLKLDHYYNLDVSYKHTMSFSSMNHIKVTLQRLYF